MIPKVLLAHVSRPMCAGLFWRDAFRQAGCEVRTIGPSIPHVYGKPSGGDHTFPDEDFVPPDYELMEVRPHDAEAMACIDPDWHPDLVVCIDQYDSFYLTGKTTAAKFAYVAIENWNVEQYTRYGQRKADAEFYMIAHSNEAPVPEGSEWMVFGADPFIHPCLNPFAPRPKLVCQIGSAYDPRSQVWNALRRYFDDADPVEQPAYLETVFETNRTIFGRIPSYRGMAEAYNSALCALSSSNVDFIPMRCSEAFAMGCVLLSDDVPAMRKAFGAPYASYVAGHVNVENANGIWIAHDRSAQSMASCIDFAAENAIPIDALRRRAYTAVFTEHLYYHRARRILDKVGIRGACRMG